MKICGRTGEKTGKTQGILKWKLSGYASDHSLRMKLSEHLVRRCERCESLMSPSPPQAVESRSDPSCSLSWFPTRRCVGVFAGRGSASCSLLLSGWSLSNQRLGSCFCVINPWGCMCLESVSNSTTYRLIVTPGRYPGPPPPLPSVCFSLDPLG